MSKSLHTSCRVQAIFAWSVAIKLDNSFLLVRTLFHTQILSVWTSAKEQKDSPVGRSGTSESESVLSAVQLHHFLVVLTANTWRINTPLAYMARGFMWKALISSIECTSQWTQFLTDKIEIESLWFSKGSHSISEHQEAQ